MSRAFYIFKRQTTVYFCFLEFVFWSSIIIGINQCIFSESDRKNPFYDRADTASACGNIRFC